MRRFAAAAAVFTTIVGITFVAPTMAVAATFTVTTCDGSGAGSLADAVANAASGDTITFDPTLSCPPASPIVVSATLVINEDLTITGPGADTMAVSGGGSVQVLDITSGTVDISGLTIENGTTGTTGGGIANRGALTLTGSTVSNNTARDGGGIFNQGALTLTGSTISGNTAASTGGGIENEGGTLTVTDGTISGNSVSGTRGAAGGGIFILVSAGTLITITDSTVSGNTASAQDANGGGIFDQGGIVRLTGSTVSNNTASGEDALGGGVVTSIHNAVSIGSSIVAGNTASGTGPNCATNFPLISVGYNLTDDATGADCGFTDPTDVVNADPGLGALGDNGGLTATVLPAAGGPAVGVIPPGTTLNAVSVCPRTDQRGVASVAGATCTIGAVEVSTVTVTVSGSQVYGGAASFTETDDAPSGVTVDTSGLDCISADGGTPLASLPVGSHTLDGSSCSGATAAHYLISYAGASSGYAVAKATPQLSWATPAPIVWGTKLSAAQLNATASVSGSFAYTPGAGAVLDPGSDTLTATFTPTDSADYTTASKMVSINVVFKPAGCITKKFLGLLVVGKGQAYCVGKGATITGGVLVAPGGALYVSGGTINGAVVAAGATAITICGVTLTGAVGITASSGPLNIGGCGPNTVHGAVVLTGNHGGLSYQHNTVKGTLAITNNTGGVTIGTDNTTTGKVIIKNNT